MSLGHAEWDMERDLPQWQIRAADALVVSSAGDATALSRWRARPAVAALTLRTPLLQPRTLELETKHFPQPGSAGEHRFPHSFNLAMPPAPANPSPPNGGYLAIS